LQERGFQPARNQRSLYNILNIIFIRDALDHKIIEYRISEKNVTLKKKFGWIFSGQFRNSDISSNILYKLSKILKKKESKGKIMIIIFLISPT